MFRIFLAFLAFSVALATPASAHDVYIEQGNDRATVLRWDGRGHRVLVVNDNECDSHRVYVLYTYRGSFGARRITDTNGCEIGGNDTIAPRRITAIQLCEYVDEYDISYCTRWYTNL